MRSGGTGRPRSTLARNGRTSSIEVGPPNVISRTASYSGMRFKTTDEHRWTQIPAAPHFPRRFGGNALHHLCLSVFICGSAAQLVHRVDQRAYVIDRRLGQDAVAEVEDVPRTTGGA